MSIKLSLAVMGMKCGGCENNVKTKLHLINGVIAVEAMNKENQVNVEFNPEKTSQRAITQAINEMGYVVK